MQSAKKNASKRPAQIVILGVVLLVVAGVVTWLLLHHTTPKAAQTIPTSPAPTSADTGKQANTGSSTTPTQSTDAPSNTANPPTDFIAPVGSFVNNHHPNLSGTPAPNSMESNCHTTPGASCHITFTKDSVVKTLETKIADADGNVTWQWKLQDAGVSEGSWSITAVASSAGKSKSTVDPMLFEVRP